MRNIAFLFALGLATAVTGSVFADASPRAVDVTSYTISDEGQLTAQLAFGSAGGAVKLYIAYGATDGGEDESAWTVQYLKTYASSDAGTVYSGIDVVNSGYTYVRFFNKGASGNAWSQVLDFTDITKPVVDADYARELWRGDGFLAACRVLYTAGSDVTVTAEVSRSGSFGDVERWPAALNAASGLYEALVQTDDTTSPRYVAPGGTFSLRFRVRTAAGVEIVTAITSSTTAAGSAWQDDLELTSTNLTVTATATLDPFGAHLTAQDGTIVRVFAGTNENELVDMGIAQLVTNEGPVSVSFSATELWVPIYVKLVATNACATGAWSDETEVVACTPEDQSTYRWTGLGKTGAWSDPQNWESDLDGVVDYPHYPGNTALFRDVQGAVAVDGEIAISRLELRGSGSDVTFTSSNLDRTNGTLTARLSCISTNATWTFSRCHMVCVAKKSSLLDFSGADSTLVFADGATVQPKDATDTASFIGADGDGLQIVVNDAMVLPIGALNFGYGSVSNDQRLVIGGKNASVRPCRTIRAAQQCDVDLVFEVPHGGYAEAPIRPYDATDEAVFTNLFNDADANANWTLSISPKSRAFATTNTVEVKLIDWSNLKNRTINTNNVHFAELGSAYKVDWIWTYGPEGSETPEERNPMGLKAKISSKVSKSGFRMVFRP